MNPSKAKGTTWESAVVEWAKQWWPFAERRTLAGAKDCGDINLGGVPIVIECKAAVTPDWSKWLAEVEVEMDNADAAIGVIFWKRRGKAKAADGLVVMTPMTFALLAKEAGY